jgi:hypothetical protein
MIKGIKKAPSILILGVLYLIICFLCLYNFPNNVLSWDVFGYYLYLPAKFIYQDLGLKDQQWLHDIIQKYHSTESLYQAYLLPNGNWILKCFIGLSIIYSPFFLVGDIFANHSSYPHDGFSYPYQLAIIICGLVYTLVGLIFFRYVLKNFFKENITGIVLIISVLGTNYFNTTVLSAAMPHNFLFTLNAVFIWGAIKWNKSKKILYAIVMAFTAGMILIVRPSEMVILLIPILINVFNKESFKEKLRIIWRNKLQIFISGIVVIIVILPQLWYWHSKSGYWIFDSYPNPGEGMDFLSPHIYNVLLSFRKGWLIYTPVMIFSILGFCTLFKENKNIFYAVLIYFIVNLYLVSCWSCWWYAGADFSQRALISSYIILAIPMGYFIKNILRKKFLKYLFFLIVGVLIGLNLFQTWQFNCGIIDGERMTAKYYFKVFGNINITPADKKLLLIERSYNGIEEFKDQNNYYCRNIGLYDFDEEIYPDYAKNYEKDTAYSGNTCLRMDSALEFSPTIRTTYCGITEKDHAWIKASVMIYITDSCNTESPLLTVTAIHKEGNYKYYTKSLKREEIVKETWKKIEMYYLTPEVRSVFDEIRIYVWNKNKQKVYIDDLKADVYTLK